jgi:superfamily II DNA or RNA helicase
LSKGVRLTTAAEETVPRDGTLVEVRGQRWVVSEPPEPGIDEESTLLTLQSVEDGRYGESLQVIWEVEPGRKILPAGSLPEVTLDGFDPPERLAAFLDAVRWSAVTSADVKTLQAPLRSGVAVEEYQLEPVARAIEAPRVNLLLADDVGLGKTIEAGLVALELLLRHRAKRVMIVCPPGLMVKWKDEMAEKFGLNFTIVDSAQLNELRRSHGSAANPFRVFPLTIVSLSWLRGAKAERLLHEVIEGTPEDAGQRPFDLLILDEAHHVAPAAPKQRYAVDSQQTKLIRWLAPYFEHRLFLSATPHNGYPESFTALLEIIDDLRFVRGVDPDPVAQRETVIRRMKSQIKDANDRPRFKKRDASAIAVTYPQSERDVHALLDEFAQLRRKRLTSKRGKAAVDLVTLLLKKRLFSSPRAFAHTVGVYLETVQARAKKPGSASNDDVPEWLEGFFDDVASYDDEEMADAETDATVRSGKIQAELTETSEREITLLRQMETWAARYENSPDAKAKELIMYLKAVCRPDGKRWTNERVVVFTEYRDTQIWLKDLLSQEGMDGEEVRLLFGGMDTGRREQLRLAFAEPPDQNKVRILLATDAASEGIDLHEHCHRLVNYDIPFNPNKLEQRIGRIDRYGQPETPEVRHFIGGGWESANDKYKADLEFLSRIAVKVARMEEDLGTVNAVLAEAVQRKMLGEIDDFDVENASAKTKRTGGKNKRLDADSNVSEQVRRLRRDLDETIGELKLTPGHVKRLVDTALELDGEQPLKPAIDERKLAEGLYEVPALTKSWARATEELYEKLEHDNQEPRRRPITFDGRTAVGRHDIVLAHLGHPLVDMSARLLRAAVWSGHTGLHRVTAVVSDDPALETTLVGAYSRFVLVGKDGIRLHEEILYAGGWVREDGTFRRVDSLSAVSSMLDRALTTGTAAAPAIQARLAGQWGKAQSGLIAAIDHRKAERLASLTSKLKAREEADLKAITVSTERFEATLKRALSEGETEEEALFSVVEGRGDEREIAQWRRDRENWDKRLRELTSKRDAELARVESRYANQADHSFPVAVIFAVPKREAVR